MRRSRPRAAVAAAILLTLLVPGTAVAASVSYVDGDSLWVASLDGSVKVKLADPVTADDGLVSKFRETAAADGGAVVGVRIPSDRDSRFNFFEAFLPDGTHRFGGLSKSGNFGSYAYPLSLDLTPDGGAMVYGYSAYTYAFPVGTLEEGFYIQSTTDSGTGDAFKVNTGMDRPTLIGRRVVGPIGSMVRLQNDIASAPFTQQNGNEFTDWLDLSNATGYDLWRTDVAATGRMVGIELDKPDVGSSATIDHRIAIVGVDGPGLSTTAGGVDCLLPADGFPYDISFSQDGTKMAWKDNGGVKVAGVPTGTANPCVLSSPPVVISATGSHPSIGGADASVWAPTPEPTASPEPTPTGTADKLSGSAPTGLKLSVLKRKGITVVVTPAETGRVSITVTVPAKALGRKGGPVVVGSATGTATAGTPVPVTIKLNKAARKKAKRLKGKKLTIRIKQGSATVTRTVTIR